MTDFTFIMIVDAKKVFNFSFRHMVMKVLVINKKKVNRKTVICVTTPSPCPGLYASIV